MTSTTNVMEIIRVVCTSCTESRTTSEVSRKTLNLTDSGSCFWISGMSAFTRLATSTVLTPGCFCTASTMARAGSSLPSVRSAYQVATRTSCTLSITWASSPRRTGAPLR